MYISVNTEVTKDMKREGSCMRAIALPCVNALDLKNCPAYLWARAIPSL